MGTPIHRKKGILFTFAAAFIVVIAFIVCFCIFGYSRKSIMEEAKRDVFSLTQYSANMVNSELESDAAAIRSIAQTISTQQAADGDRINDLLATYQGAEDHLYLGIVDSTGICTLTEGTTFSVIDEPEYARCMAGESCFSKPFANPLTGEQIITINCPIAGQAPSYLRCAISVPSLVSRFNLYPYSYNSLNLIIHRDGDILFSFPRIDTPDKINLYDSTPLHAIGIDSDFKALKDSFSQSVWGTDDLPSGKASVVVGYSPLGAVKDWMVVSIVPLSDIEDRILPLHSSAAYLLYAGIYLHIASFVLIFIFYRYGKRKTNRLAMTDGLTGLSNKTNFMNLAASLIRKNPDANYAVISMDINRFRYINVLRGFETGDRFLRLVADVLAGALFKNEICAHSSEDVFLLLITNRADQETLARLDAIYEQIASQAKALLPGFPLTFCSGIHRIENRHLSVDQMIDRANYARLKSKGEYKNVSRFSTRELQAQSELIRFIETNMIDALHNREFKAFIQPKIDLSTDQIMGGEALIRWESPTLGLIGPDQFIDIFEHNGFVTQLDYYMLDKVCAMMAHWRSEGRELLPISINFSQLHLYDPGFINMLQTTCQRYKLEPHYIELEMTERVLSGDYAQLIAVISELHNAGFSLSMDDFGTGVSSLSVLKDIPVNTIKLDKSFLHGQDFKRSYMVLSQIILLIQALHMTVVAEGVETAEQAEFLKQVHCNYAQGYYYSHPLPAEDFAALMKQSIQKEA